jgi:hypothetical protein
MMPIEPGTRGGTARRITLANRGRSENSRLAAKQAQATAQDLAVAVLRFIAAEPRRLGRFLEMTGIAPESIREAARETQFLAGVLDHISDDEPLLLDFAAQAGIDPKEVIRACAILSGHCRERDTP